MAAAVVLSSRWLVEKVRQSEGPRRFPPRIHDACLAAEDTLRFSACRFRAWLVGFFGPLKTSVPRAHTNQPVLPPDLDQTRELIMIEIHPPISTLFSRYS